MITPSFSITATERVLPKLALDFTTASLDPRVTFARTTDATHPATYINSSGYVTSATDNQPRFDYNPTALTCNGLLIEESRSNLMKYSSDFANAFWSTQRASISSDAAVAPDNTSTADKLVEDTTATNSHQVYSGAFGTAATYTFTVFAKAAGRSTLQIQQESGGNSKFLLSGSGTATALGANTVSITQLGNGWYRCSTTFTATGAFIVYLQLNDGTTTFYTGNGVSGIYLWGAQLEVGAFPTSYIPTTSAALTRNADVATMTGTNFSDWYNASEGTFVATSIPSESGVAGVLKGIVTVSDGTESNTIRLAYRGAGTFAYQSVVSSSTIVNDTPSPAWTTGTTYKMCGAYILNSYASAVNGNTNTLDTSATVPTVDRCTLGALGSNIQPLNGHLRYLAYYPQRLTNAEVQAFSK